MGMEKVPSAMQGWLGLEDHDSRMSSNEATKAWQCLMRPKGHHLCVGVTIRFPGSQ